jgi:Protein of unknown function (DUF998)
LKIEHVVEPEKQQGLYKKTTPYGAFFFIVATVQFIICIAITASRYGPPAYNPVTVTISDLQAVNCGIFQGAYICSPLHDLANISVATLGLLVIAGSLSFRTRLSASRRRDVAVSLLLITGLAALANAFTPEDITLTGDLITAIIAFLGANFGLIQIGRTLSVDPLWRGYAIFSDVLGTVGIGALILDGFGLGTAIGEGAIEWLIVAPILVWELVIGLRLILRK